MRIFVDFMRENVIFELWLCRGSRKVWEWCFVICLCTSTSRFFL